EKMREIFRRGDHWEVYSSYAEIQPEFSVQNGICVVKKAERSCITFEVVGTMENICCDLPAACDVTKTGYGFLKYRVVIAEIDEFVTLRKVMANTALLPPLHETEITSRGLFIRACQNSDTATLDDLYSAEKLTNLTTTEVGYAFDTADRDGSFCAAKWIISKFGVVVDLKCGVDKKLREMLKSGNVEAAKWLVAEALPQANISMAQITAAREGNLEFLKWLLTESRLAVAIDPCAIEAAIAAKKKDVADWLLDVAPRLQKVAAFKYGLKVVQPEIDRRVLLDYAKLKCGATRKIIEL
ncbi:MAG: hypothetical protein JZU65_12270, partial [Chlorobium sp.]|nr:hypothetical protein [Chlorobium sp.]